MYRFISPLLLHPAVMSQVGVVVVIPSSQMVDLSDHKPPVLCQLSLIDYLYLFEYTSCNLIIALALPQY